MTIARVPYRKLFSFDYMWREDLVDFWPVMSAPIFLFHFLGFFFFSIMAQWNRATTKYEGHNKQGGTDRLEEKKEESY